MTTRKTTISLLGAALVALAGPAAAQTDGQATELYIVELTDPPATTYTGTIPGMAATRAAGGSRFSPRSSAVRTYQNMLQTRQRATLSALGTGVRPVHSYTNALNGFAVALTQDQARQLRAQSNVASVTVAGFSQLVTHHTPDEMGLTGGQGLWSNVDAAMRNAKGEDVIVGVIDSGVWPENASVGDKVDANGAPLAYGQGGVPAYGLPPAGWAGTCQTGPGFTADMCGNKLIGARFYVSGFLAGGATLSPMEYVSPRDGSGHGSHTSSTAVGNSAAPALLNGVKTALISGMAPRARLAVYKACWQATDPRRHGCSNADLVKAYEDAIADGVHVINYSISGNTTLRMGAVERAQLNAAAAGIFVAAAAGNSGPANQVNHINPWVTTVAAAADDRTFRASVYLGNGAEVGGLSVFLSALPTAPLVLGNNAALPGLAAAGQVCTPGSLDPLKTRGRIVVCDRDTTVTRLDKSVEVLRAGGVGMVLLNVQRESLQLDSHSVPTVHVGDLSRGIVRAYAAQDGATARIGQPSVPQLAIAPQIANYSSRGPNRGVASIMKPDIAATGSAVLAAFLDPSLTQAQHDALVVGNYRAKSSAAIEYGTSMATPHVAGVAALIRQLHPTWTPAAIKSAMQTTTLSMKNYDGTPDTNAWNGGAGFINPRGAAHVPLVYDVSGDDYGRFLCGLNLDPGKIGTCDTLGSLPAWDLNLASINAGPVLERATLRRTITNVTNAQLVVNASTSLPGWAVTVTPSQLTLPPGGKGSFTVDMVVQPSAFVGIWSMGSLSWSDGLRTVTSPLMVQRAGFKAPELVTDQRKLASGRKIYSVTSGRFVSVSKMPGNGLMPATLTSGRAVPGTTQCTDFDVPAGIEVARFQLFNADTEGGSATDLNLQLIRGKGGVGELVESSTKPGSDEAVSMLSPAAGAYSVCVVPASVSSAGATYTLSSWIMAPGPASTLRVQATPFMMAGSPASVGLAWQAPLGQRYLGTVRYLEGGTTPMAPLTQVLIDNK